MATQYDELASNSMIQNFVWNRGSHRVRWDDGKVGSEPIVKTYASPVLDALVLRDGSGVAVCESVVGGYNQATVFNEDGSERFRVSVPGERYKVNFVYVFYEGEHLTLIASGNATDWAYLIDETNGAILSNHQWR